MYKFKKHNLFLLVLSMLLIVSIVLVGCGGNQPEQTEPENKDGIVKETTEEFKVAFVYPAPIGGSGWITSHDLGRKYLEEQFSNVKTTYVENVPEGSDCERVLTQLAEQGYKVIFAESFGYTDSVIQVAEKYPDTVFIQCSGYKTAKNVGTYSAHMEQAKYLAGLVAGKMTKTNLVGYVVAFPIPECVRILNGFALGVREVNPNAKVKIIWTNSWYNPAVDKEATLSLIDVGCDVITQDLDSPAPQQAANEKGVYAIGYHSDMTKFAPDTSLTSAVWYWGAFYAKTVKEVMEGTWKPSEYWGPMSDGVVGLTPFTDLVPEEVQKYVEQRKEDIVSGKYNPFQGPIKDNQGNLRVKEGEIVTDEELLVMDWLVEGIDGNIPK